VRPGLRLKYFLTDRYSLGLEASGQYSDQTVPEQQQWVLGGLGNLTAYLPGLAVGDKGYLMRLQGEAGAYPVYRGVELRPRAFVEYAATQYNSLGGGDPRVADAGVELGFKLVSWLSGSVAYARSFYDKDVPQPVLDATDARVYFRLQGEFGS
jgi:hemolysin activation/secretion protein